MVTTHKSSAMTTVGDIAGKFSPTMEEIFLIARENAHALGASELYPEHIFLALILFDDTEIVETLTDLAMDARMLREQAQATFTLHRITKRAKAKDLEIAFSKEMQDCLSWAISLAATLHASPARPVHVLLGTMRHQRIQPLLALLLAQIETVLPAYITEETAEGYTRAVEQLIHARIRVQQRVRSDNVSGVGARRMLSSIERPTLLFADILGFHNVKHSLWNVVEFLRKPQLAYSPRQVSVYGMLLVGAPGNNRSLLARAVAGEATVPLLCLSLPALVEMVSVVESDEIGEFDVDLSREQYARVHQQQAIQKGRAIIRDIFAKARQISPCILLLDDLDAIERVEHKICEQWQKQLIVEMDARDYYPTMVVIATTSRPDYLDAALLVPGRFEPRIVLDGTVMQAFTRGAHLCPSCQHEVSPRWKFCAYCGESLAITCGRCGTRLPDLHGVRFCPECGTVVA